MEKEFEYILSNIHNDIPKNIAQRIKHYIYNNRDNEEVKIFIYKLILEYKKYFDSNEVINALNISEQFTYLKRQEISKIIPSSNLITNLFNILEYPEYYGSLKGFFELCIYLISSIPNSEDTTKRIQMLIDFTENNQCIIRGSKDEYESLENEIKYYEEALQGNFNNPNYERFKAIIKLTEMPTEENLKRRYINKKLGNIGELLTLKAIKEANLTEPHLIAQELGNGYGYDIYFQTINQKEVLVEIKTTAKTNDNEYFTLTDNEIKIFRETQNNPNAEYIICRVIYHNKENISLILLQYNAETNNFVSTNYKQDNIEYIAMLNREENKIEFRQTPEFILQKKKD